MRVIVVNDHLVPDGGADVVALASAEALASAGVAVTLLVGDRAVETAAMPAGVTVVCTGQRDLASNPSRAQAALQGLWNNAAARAMRTVLQRHDPGDTVVHLHSWTKSLSSSVVRAAVSAGYPVVCTLHDYFAVCPNGAFFDFQSGSVCHRRPMSADCLRTHCDSRHYAVKLYRAARFALQSGPGGLPDSLRDFIVVSRFSERVLAPYLPAAARLHPVRNPIEVKHGPLAPVADADAFVMVARLLQPKGQHLFLEACERAGLRAVCVGDGPELQALRHRFTGAEFTGQLPRAEVVRVLRSARALVMPALWYETHGLVVDEAAALGVPSVVADGCAASEAVIDGDNGLHFRSADVADLAAKLRRLHEDPALAARLGANAYQRFWAAPPTRAQHAHDLLAVYREMLSRRTGAAASTHPA